VDDGKMDLVLAGDASIVVLEAEALRRDERELHDLVLDRLVQVGTAAHPESLDVRVTKDDLVALPLDEGFELLLADYFTCHGCLLFKWLVEYN